jgi:hypothetical protein
MYPRIKASLAVVLLAALSAAPAAAARSRTPARCRLSRRETVVLHNAYGVVSKTSKRFTSGSREGEYEETWRACLVGVWREWLLGRSGGRENGGGADGFRGFQLVGPYLTFASEYSSRYGIEDTRIIQYDLRSGRRTFSTDYRYGSGELERQTTSVFEGPRAAWALVSNLAGDSAWNVRLFPLSAPPTANLIVRDRAGVRSVATYPPLMRLGNLSVPSSISYVPSIQHIAISATEVSWLHGSERLSAPLEL